MASGHICSSADPHDDDEVVIEDTATESSHYIIIKHQIRLQLIQSNKVRKKVLRCLEFYVVPVVMRSNA